MGHQSVNDFSAIVILLDTVMLSKPSLQEQRLLTGHSACQGSSNLDVFAAFKVQLLHHSFHLHCNCCLKQIGKDYDEVYDKPPPNKCCC